MNKRNYLFLFGISFVLTLAVLSLLSVVATDDFVDGFNPQTGIVREGGTVPVTYSGNIKCENIYCSFKMQVKTSSGVIIETWITLYDGSVVQTNISSSTGVTPIIGSELLIYDINYALSSENWQIWRNFSTPCKNCTFFPGDYDGDGVSDILGFSNEEKQGYFVLSSSWSTWYNFDIPGCESSYTCNLIPVTGDFDGDKKADFVAYDYYSGMFGYLLSSENYGVWRYGDTPCKNCSIISGDYNGDAVSDLVGYNQESKTIHFALSPNWEWQYIETTTCADCIFFPGDYNADGISDILGLSNAEKKVYLAMSPNWEWIDAPFSLCPEGEDCNFLPISGDFDGDKKTEFVAYNPSSGIISYLMSSENYLTLRNLQTPCKNCTVINGDYDGDKISDLALYGSFSSSSCISESNATFCSGHCSTISKEDNCGVYRTNVNCGDCSSGTCLDGVCVCDNSCAVNTCVGSTCTNNCGQTIKGTKEPQCQSTSDAACGVQINSMNGCGTCGTGTKCDTGQTCVNKACILTWYLDYDNDNFGNNTRIGCWEGSIIQPDSATKPYKDCNGGRHYYVKNNLDCNPTNSAVSPGAPEICNGIENNCNGIIDDEGCIIRANWTNLLGKEITETNINDTVLLNIDGTSLTDKSITYKTFGSQSFLWIFTRLAQLSSSDSPSWIANISGSPVSFNASIIKDSVFITSKKSGELTVSTTYNNFLPVAIITSPSSELNISAGENIIFNQSSYDEDDLLKITWDFGDGTTQTITNYVNSTGEGDFNTTANAVHNYSSSGRYLAKLTAEEMERGQKDSKEIYINVFSTGINVFPVISSPYNETKEQPWVVLFDASKSFVTNCSLDNISSDVIISGNNLYCKYIHAPGAPINSSKYELEMDWTINGESSPISVTGSWSSDYPNVVRFRQAFSSKGNHNLSLTMTYIAGSAEISESANRNFKVESLWDCSSDGSYWTNDRYEPVRNNCSYKQNELGHACCPASTKCSSDGSCKGYASYCWQYPDKSSCELFINYVPEKSVSSASSIKQNYYFDSATNKHCSNLTSFLCKWNSSLNKCVEGINSTKSCWKINSAGEVEEITNEDYGECLWSITEVVDNCDSSNEMVTKKKALWVSKDSTVSIQPDWCKDMEISYQCALTEKLPFFDNIGVIIAVIFIIFIYFYALRRQKKIVENIEKTINPRETKKHK